MYRCCGVFHPSFFVFPLFYNKNHNGQHKSGEVRGFIFIFNAHLGTSLEVCKKFDTRRHLFKFIWNKTFPRNLWMRRALDAHRIRVTLIAIEFSRSTAVMCHQMLSNSTIWHGAKLMNRLAEVSTDYIDDAAHNLNIKERQLNEK